MRGPGPRTAYCHTPHWSWHWPVVATHPGRAAHRLSNEDLQPANLIVRPNATLLVKWERRFSKCLSVENVCNFILRKTQQYYAYENSTTRLVITYHVIFVQSTITSGHHCDQDITAAGAGKGWDMLHSRVARMEFHASAAHACLAAFLVLDSAM